MKLLREPLVHFLAIGAAIFVLYGFMGQKDAGEINWLTDTWKKRWNRPPTEKERAGIIDQGIGGTNRRDVLK